MKHKPNFIAGFVLGAVIFGSATAFSISVETIPVDIKKAAGVIANRTTSRVYVNGAEIYAEAYNINGSNYFKLRDVGAAVDFAVDWDGESNSIRIDTSRPYTAELATAPTVTSTPTSSPSVVPEMTIDEMKAEIVRLTNEERAKAGLSALEVLPELADCAQAKAQDFADSHYYGHTSPIYGTFGDMIKSYVPKAKSAAENIAPGRATTDIVMTDWLASDGHKANILNAKFTHIGIGIIPTADGRSYMWVQQFVKL